MAKEITQGIGFTVNNIEMARKEGAVAIDVTFDNRNWKNYHYIRQYSVDSKGNYKIQIDGCAVTFIKNPLTDGFTVINYTRLHDTQGKKRFRTSSISGNIKNTMDEKDIQIPEVTTPVYPEEPTIPVVDDVEYDSEGNVKHEKYNMIKTCLDCGIPVYLAGPAGSGKNFTVEQIAKENDWEFFYSNSIQQEYKLTGFIDAGGDYHETEFYKACHCDKECVFFLDEIDASIPEVLVLLNAAIANGYFEFPTGRVNLENVHFVAAGNTVGSGADEMYTGRLVLDQATLDRFAIIEFDYCENIELNLTKNNKELVDFVHALRKEAKEKGIRATFSYRCLTMVTKLEAAGMDINTILTIAIFKGLDKDTVNTFSCWNMPIGKYRQAMSDIQNAA